MFAYGEHTHTVHMRMNILFILPPLACCCCSYHSFACIFICCCRRPSLCAFIDHPGLEGGLGTKVRMVARTQNQLDTMRISLNFSFGKIVSNPFNSERRSNSTFAHLINNNLFVKCHFSHSMFVIPA